MRIFDTDTWLRLLSIFVGLELNRDTRRFATKMYLQQYTYGSLLLTYEAEEDRKLVNRIGRIVIEN